MTLGRLKWLAIVLPITFVATMWALLHTVLLRFHHFPGLLVVLSVTVVGISLFAVAVFAVVNRFEERILVQNRELEQRTQELEAVLAVGRAASSSLELGELLDAAMDEILAVTNAEAAEIWLRSAPGELVLARCRGVGASELAEQTRLRDGEGLPGQTATTAAPAIVHDLQDMAGIPLGLDADERSRHWSCRPRSRSSSCGSCRKRSPTSASMRVRHAPRCASRWTRIRC
jgi:hypothetical protein